MCPPGSPYTVAQHRRRHEHLTPRGQLVALWALPELMQVGAFASVRAAAEARTRAERELVVAP
jgi:hypothetical protein